MDLFKSVNHCISESEVCFWVGNTRLSKKAASVFSSQKDQIERVNVAQGETTGK